MKYYAGIGSRQTPNNILQIMTKIAQSLSKDGFTLRSGHADGADYAFEQGADQAEIWLPWPTFNSNKPVNKNHVFKVIADSDEEAFASVKQYHEAYHMLTFPIRRLMARNYRQIVGKDGAPNVEFVICWTNTDINKGGTRQAIKIAEALNIPVYNLYDQNVCNELLHQLNIPF